MINQGHNFRNTDSCTFSCSRNVRLTPPLDAPILDWARFPLGATGVAGSSCTSDSSSSKWSPEYDVRLNATGVVVTSILSRAYGSAIGCDGEGVERVAEDGAVEGDVTDASLCSGLGGEQNEMEPREPRERSARVPAESLGPSDESDI